MMPTPTVVETAIMSAAMATAVRESELVIPRAAMRPRSPKLRPAIGPRMLRRPMAAAGVRKAQAHPRVGEQEQRSAGGEERSPGPGGGRHGPASAGVEARAGQHLARARA